MTNIDDMLLMAMSNRSSGLPVNVSANNDESLAFPAEEGQSTGTERPPLRIDIEGVGQPSEPEEVGPAPPEEDLTGIATQMAAGAEPEGATPMSMGEFATSVADVPAALAKGIVQGTVGAPADIYSLGRAVFSAANPNPGETRLQAFIRSIGDPVEVLGYDITTEGIKKIIDGTIGPLVPEGAGARRTEAAGTAETTGEIFALGRMAKEIAVGMAKGVQRVGEAANIAGDKAVQAITGNPQATAMGVLEEAGQMSPLSRIVPGVQPQASPQRSDIGFYSAVEKAVLDSKQEKGTGAQFLAQITKTQGVKPEELKWTGLDEFLKGKKSVTKQEIQDYLNANRVDVREVRLGGDAQFTSPDEALNYLAARRGGTVDGVIEDYGYTDNQDYVTLANNIYRTLDSTSTKFSKYTLPGGENYREILLTLPSGSANTQFLKIASDYAKEFGIPENIAKMELRAHISNPSETPVPARYEQMLARSGSANQFKSTHFDQPNILAHMRVNDRVVDGKRTLFIEEVQSDWHQAGRKRGYSEPGKPFEVFDPRDGNVISRFATEREAKAYADQLGPQVDYARSEGVPDAPFKTSWHELTLKRAIQEASEKGYDQIAITTGKTQAERYDLSKQIDRIELHQSEFPNKQTRPYYLTAFDKDGRRVLDDTVAESNIEEYIGKEAASKVLSMKADPSGVRVLEGADLQVGGEGMKGFYDNILPKSLEKLGKKFDAKVGKTEMDGVEVWQMDITPKMRETVTKQGQPLFQIGVGGGAAAGAATMQDNEERM